MADEPTYYLQSDTPAVLRRRIDQTPALIGVDQHFCMYPGAHLSKVARLAVEVARVTRGAVLFTFQEIKLRVAASHQPEEVEEAFNTGYAEHCARQQRINEARELADRCLMHLHTAQAALRFEALVRGADSTVATGAVTKLLAIVTLLSQAEGVLLEVDDLSDEEEVLECLGSAARLCAEALERVKAAPDDLWETPGMVANLRRVSELLEPHVTLSPRATEEGS